MSNRLYGIEKNIQILFWRDCSSKHVASQEEFESQNCLTCLHVYRLLWGNSRLPCMTCSNPLIPFSPLRNMQKKNMQKNMQCLSMHWILETASWHSHRQFFYVWGAVAGAWRFKLNFVWLLSDLKPVFFSRFVPVGQLLVAFLISIAWPGDDRRWQFWDWPNSSCSFLRLSPYHLRKWTQDTNVAAA